MNISANILVEKELIDLAVPRNSQAWKLIYDSSIGAFGVLSRKELRAYIEEFVASLPNDMFHE